MRDRRHSGVAVRQAARQSARRGLRATLSCPSSEDCDPNLFVPQRRQGWVAQSKRKQGPMSQKSKSNVAVAGGESTLGSSMAYAGGAANGYNR